MNYTLKQGNIIKMKIVKKIWNEEKDEILTKILESKDDKEIEYLYNKYLTINKKYINITNILKIIIESI